MTIDTQKLRALVALDYEVTPSLYDAVQSAADQIDDQAAQLAAKDAEIAALEKQLSDKCAEIARLRDALEWYASMAKRMGKAALHGDSQAILTLMKEVAVDYGKKARAALSGEGK